MSPVPIRRTLAEGTVLVPIACLEAQEHGAWGNELVSLELDGLKVPRADVLELSRQWRSVMSNVDYASSAIAMRVLGALVTAYLRGRGCRMGNRDGLTRHFDKASALIDAVSTEAAERFEDMCRFEKSVRIYLTEHVDQEAS